MCYKKSQLLKNMYCITLTCALFFLPVSGENDTYIPVHIDGFNTILINQEYPDQSLNMYSIIYGNPLDQFPFSSLTKFKPLYEIKLDSLKKSDSLFHLEVAASIGGETGELMLNAFEGMEQENRDHFTTFATAASFPHSPLDLYFGYRYLDHYSDRYDGLWKSYEEKTGNKMSFDKQGLAYEFAGGYVLSGPITATSLKTTSYKHWGATPYYFSPVFSSGYLLAPSLIFSLPKSKLFIDFIFDYHKDFYDHVNFIEYTDESWDITWQRQLRKGISAQLSHHKDSRLSPSTRLNATVYGSIPELFKWTLSGNVFGNYRVGGSLDVDYIQIPTITVNINTGWHFIPKTRDYTFWNDTKQIDYHAKKYDVATLHSSIQYDDTLFFPVQARVWLHYCEKPLWETFEWGSEKNILRQDTISNAARLTFGGKASYKITFKKFSATLWGNMAITPKNKEIRYSLPRNLGADIAYGNPDNSSFYAMLRLENRDGSSLKYLDVGANETFQSTIPATTSASLILKMPFILPFLKKYVHTGFQIEAGPIQFSKEQRVLQHPRGNLIGPAISIGINGFIN